MDKNIIGWRVTCPKCNRTIVRPVLIMGGFVNRYETEWQCTKCWNIAEVMPIYQEETKYVFVF